MRKISLTAFLLLTVASITRAQYPQGGASFIGGPGTSGSGILANGQTAGSPTVPFDGGLSLILLANGVGYAAKQLGKRKLA